MSGGLLVQLPCSEQTCAAAALHRLQERPAEGVGTWVAQQHLHLAAAVRSRSGQQQQLSQWTRAVRLLPKQ